jgi:small conductance mechanosensitive channel
MTGLIDELELFADIYLLPLVFRILIAILIFYAGRLIARQLVKGLDRLMETSKLDVSLRRFLHDIAYAVMIVAVIVAALDAVGVRTTAVIAVLGAAGLAIGLALQGSLSNFAAGVMLIVLRPYKVGDLVTIAKYTGRVEGIRVFHTVLVTADNREITIPNGKIIGEPIENLTVLGMRRVDLVVSVAEAADLPRVKQLLDDTLQNDDRIEAMPAPAINVSEITEAGVKLTVRPWTSIANYERVATAVMERVRDAASAAGFKVAVVLQTV